MPIAAVATDLRPGQGRVRTDLCRCARAARRTAAFEPPCFASTFDNAPPLRLVMEARGTVHDWARRFQHRGHAVTLLPADAVRPYVLGNETDRTDAAGSPKSDRCGAIRLVPVKTPEQQRIQGPASCARAEQGATHRRDQTRTRAIARQRSFPTCNRSFS